MPCIQLPNTVVVVSTVVVRVAAKIGDHPHTPQQVPKPGSVAWILAQAVSIVPQPPIVRVRLRKCRLVAKNKDVILSSGLQIVHQPVVQVVRHISTCNRIPASVAVLVEHHKVCVFVIKRVSALRTTRWSGVYNDRRDTYTVLVVIATTQ